MRSVNYAGIELTEFLNLQRVNRSVLPPREVSLLEVPARHGAYFSGARWGVRRIELEVAIRQADTIEFMQAVRYLAYCLDVEEPTDLIISDEPEKVHYAILSDDTGLEQVLTRGKGTLTFLCPDPFAYSLNPKTITPVERLFTFENQGTTVAFPRFTVNFANEASFASFISPDGVILIGNPSEPDQIKQKLLETKLNDPMESTSGWATAGTSFDVGRVNSGSVEVKDGYGLGAASYGTATAGNKMWHGPAIRKDLSESLKDFTVKVRLNFTSGDGTANLDGDRMGRLEIYLYDVNGLKLGKLIMRDSYSAYEFNIPEIYIANTSFLESQPKAPAGKKVKQKQYTTYVVKKGNTLAGIAKAEKMKVADLAKLNNLSVSAKLSVGQKLKVFDKTITKTVYPEHVGSYNDFYGEMVFSRHGDRFLAEVTRISETGKRSKPLKKILYDRGHKWVRNDLSYIVIHFLQYENKPPVDINRVTHLQVLKNNSETVIDVPALFDAGDELEVDVNDSSVWLNGEPFMQHVDVGSSFFPIPEGTTEVKVNTDDPDATFSAEFTERWL